MAAQIRPEQYVIFLDRNRLQICGKSLSQILTLDLPQSGIGDLEIKKFEDFNLTVKAFIEKAHLSPGIVLLIFSQYSCFTKDFPAGKEGFNDSEVDKFLKSIPFDYLLFKKYRINKIDRVVAINRELYDGLRSILENLGFTVIGAVPAQMAGVDLQAGLSPNVGKELVKRMAALRSEALVLEEEGRKLDEESTSSDPRKNRKLLILLLVFGSLALVLAILLVSKGFGVEQKIDPKENTENRETQTTPSQPTTPIVTSATLTATPTPGASPADQSIGQLRLEILNASGVTGQAENVRKSLTDLGFKNILTANSEIINSDHNQIAFSASMSAALQQTILSKLNGPLSPLSVLGNQTSGFDLIVTLTKIASSGASKITP